MRTSAKSDGTTCSAAVLLSPVDYMYPLAAAVPSIAIDVGNRSWPSPAQPSPTLHTEQGLGSLSCQRKPTSHVDHYPREVHWGRTLVAALLGSCSTRLSSGARLWALPADLGDPATAPPCSGRRSCVLSLGHAWGENCPRNSAAQGPIANASAWPPNSLPGSSPSAVRATATDIIVVIVIPSHSSVHALVLPRYRVNNSSG